MKGKRNTIEQKIRVRREAERSDKTILDVCRQQQISEQHGSRLLVVWLRQPLASPPNQIGTIEFPINNASHRLPRSDSRLRIKVSGSYNPLWSRFNPAGGGNNPDFVYSASATNA